MPKSFVPRVGGILSADIAVPEHEREVDFYSRVLGTGKEPLWRQDLMNNLGMPVIGLGERNADYAHLPLQWMPHLQVADVAASVKQALDLQGTELMHGKDEAGRSQWAVLLDPNGAAFGLIPVVSEADVEAPEGSEAADAVGEIAWLDLTVSSLEATKDFYRQVVGWEIQDVEMTADGARYVDYNMLAADGVPAARIRRNQGANIDLPPLWILYLPVGDLDESLRQVRAAGGKVFRTTMGPRGTFASAVIQDPVGAWFGLVPGSAG